MTPFEQQLAEGKTINVNGNDMPLAVYNLIISRRDLKLWAVGLKPHRRWKVSDVKKYFGFKGSKDKLVAQADALLMHL
jgi:hypothetical protein